MENKRKLGFLALSILTGIGVISSNINKSMADTPNLSSPEDFGSKPNIPSTPPPQKTPTPTQTPPPASQPPSTPIPSPSPTPEVCTYISGSLNDKGTRHGKYSGNIFEKYGDTSKFSCIDQLINQVKASAKNWKQYWNDDSYANILASIVFPDRVGKNQKVGIHSNGAVCNSLYNGDVPKGKQYCGSGSFFMDANTCKIIQNPNGLQCAKFELNYFKGCPISLISEKGAEKSVKRAVVPFSLSNNKSDWVIWKGSEKTPLLVFNPKHDGKITSVEQLFGEWTFGGNRSASLNTDVKTSARPWKNGYEALGQLDTDKNGKIDGSELKDLALWFDNNQDAVSQAGEVKNLSELNISSIFYKNTKKLINGDIEAEIGFERNLDGKIEFGKSVDWYTEVSDSPHSLIQLYSMDEKMNSDFGSNTNIDENNLSDDQGITSGTSKFSGLWKWKAKTNDDSFGGYISFKKADDMGNLIGFSLTERALATSPSENIKTGGGLFAFDGFESIVNGKNKITFNMNQNGNLVSSKAILSSDGKTLNGVSIAKGKMNGEEIELTYHWTAIKETAPN